MQDLTILPTKDDIIKLFIALQDQPSLLLTAQQLTYQYKLYQSELNSRPINNPLDTQYPKGYKCVRVPFDEIIANLPLQE